MIDTKPQPYKYDMAIRELRDVLNDVCTRRFDVTEIADKLQKAIRRLENARDLEIAKTLEG